MAKEVSALYVTIREGQVSRTLTLRNDVIVDVDQDDRILGVEVLY